MLSLKELTAPVLAELKQYLPVKCVWGRSISHCDEPHYNKCHGQLIDFIIDTTGNNNQKIIAIVQYKDNDQFVKAKASTALKYWRDLTGVKTSTGSTWKEIHVALKPLLQSTLQSVDRKTKKPKKSRPIDDILPGKIRLAKHILPSGNHGEIAKFIDRLPTIMERVMSVETISDAMVIDNISSGGKPKKKSRKNSKKKKRKTRKRSDSSDDNNINTDNNDDDDDVDVLSRKRKRTISSPLISPVSFDIPDQIIRFTDKMSRAAIMPRVPILHSTVETKTVITLFTQFCSDHQIDVKDRDTFIQKIQTEADKFFTQPSSSDTTQQQQQADVMQMSQDQEECRSQKKPRIANSNDSGWDAWNNVVLDPSDFGITDQYGSHCAI